MTELMVKNGKPEILSSIRRAIENELKILELSIQKTQNNISQLENKYGLKTNIFLEQLQKNIISDDNLDFIDWQGELQLLQSLENEYTELNEVVLCE